MASGRDGIFVVLEGGEGVGKTTQVGHLKEYLAQEFPEREILFTREPGGSEFGKLIRELILSDHGKRANGRTLLGLFAADRADHVHSVIDPALERGAIVICDRYLPSTYAYQIVAQEDPHLEELFWAHARLMPEPDLTLLFDVEPSVAMERTKARGAQSHFDARDEAFHARIRSGFADYFSKKTDANMRKLDASRAKEEVWNDVREAVLSVVQ